MYLNPLLKVGMPVLMAVLLTACDRDTGRSTGHEAATPVTSGHELEAQNSSGIPSASQTLLKNLEQHPGALNGSYLALGAMAFSGIHQAYPDALNQIDALLPVSGLLSQYSGLVVAEGYEGKQFLLAESAFDPASYEIAASEQLPDSVTWSELSPKLGFDGAVKRGFVIPMSDADHLISAPENSGLFTQLPGMLQTPFDTPPDAELPEISVENAKLGLMVFAMENLLLNQALNSESGYGPATLGEFATRAGGLNDGAWTNPYTGDPMANVPLESPSPGDYTELPDPEGLQLAFHYRTVTGTVGTRIVGERGLQKPITLDGRNIGSMQ